jgi:hypothetical protein
MMCPECSGRAELSDCDGCHFTTCRACNGVGELESGSNAMRTYLRLNSDGEAHPGLPRSASAVSGRPRAGRSEA